MQAMIVITAFLCFLAMITLAAVRESAGSKWLSLIQGLQFLFVVIWLGLIVMILVFFPGSVSSTPDPRF